MRTKLLAVVATVGLLVGGLTVAHAATRTVTGGSVSTAQAGPCRTTPPIQATRADPQWWGLGGYNAVQLAIPTECQGTTRVVDVSIVRTSDGSRVSSGSRTGLTATTTVGVSPTYGGLFAPAYRIVMTIDGWSVPVTFRPRQGV